MWTGLKSIVHASNKIAILFPTLAITRLQLMRYYLTGILKRKRTLQHTYDQGALGAAVNIPCTCHKKLQSIDLLHVLCSKMSHNKARTDEQGGEEQEASFYLRPGAEREATNAVETLRRRAYKEQWKYFNRLIYYIYIYVLKN